MGRAPEKVMPHQVMSTCRGGSRRGGVKTSVFADSAIRQAQEYSLSTCPSAYTVLLPRQLPYPHLTVQCQL